jgi:hypothetical protein
MSEPSRLVPLNIGRSVCVPSVAGAIVAIIFIVPFASRTTKANSQQYSVVARVAARSAGLTSRDIVVRVENVSVPAIAIRASPEIPRNIAIVLDAGPDQAKVLAKEKDLAIALINELASPATSFTIAKAGTSPTAEATTLDRSAAIDHIREIAADSGEKTNVPIYDAIGSAIRQISVAPGLRIVIFIGEGNDGGSRLGYPELRSLAESNQIAFFSALVADHSLRGPKAILRYGWNLRELTSDTAGIFLENTKTQMATRRLTENVRDLRLIAFEMPPRQSGRYKVSVKSLQGKRLPAQNAIVTP